MPPRPEIEALLEHRDFLMSLARQLVSDPMAQDELVSDALEEAALAPPRHGFLRPWLSRVLQNRAKNRGRAISRRERHERLAARPEGLPSSAEVVTRFELSERLAEMVDQLPDAYRQVVLFRYYEGLPPRAIAKSLGIPVETVKTRLRRALDQLRQSLDRDHGSREKWLGALTPLTLPSASTAALGASIGGTLLMSTKTLVPIVLVPLLGLLVWINLPDTDNSTSLPPPQEPTIGQVVSTPASEVGSDTNSNEGRRPIEKATHAPAIHSLFRGKLVTSDGQPVTNAIVVALDAEQSLTEGPDVFLKELNDWKRQFSKLEREFEKTQKPDNFCRTDEEGAYSLVLGESAVQVLAWSDIHGLEALPIPDLKARLGLIVMKSRCRIECRVRDEKARPMADLWVQILQTNPNRPFLNGMTDASGVFVSPPLDPGTYLVFANKRGYKDGLSEVRTLGSLVSCDVRLERRTEFACVLTDKDSVPWTGVRITAATGFAASDPVRVHLTRVRVPYLLKVNHLHYGENHMKYHAETGRITGRLDDPAARFLSIWKAGLLVGEARLPDDLPEEIPVHISFLHDEIEIEALVRSHADLAQGAPCRVDLLKAGGLLPGPFGVDSTQTTNSGSVKFRVERQSLLAPSYLMATQGSMRSKVVRIPPIDKPSRSARVWLDLRPVVKDLRGQIMSNPGQPIPDALVVIVDSNGDRIVRANALSATRTNKKGEFLFDAVHTGGVLTGNALLYVSAKGFAPAVHEVVISEKCKILEPIRLYPGITRKITRPHGGMVHITVLDAVGRVIHSDRLAGISRGGRTIAITVPPGKIQIIVHDVITGKRLPYPPRANK